MTRSLARRPLLGLVTLSLASGAAGRSQGQPIATAAAAPATAASAAPATAASAAPATGTAPQDRGATLRILFAGDSLAQGLYLSTVGPLRRRPEVRTINGTKHATGLTRSDEWDWVSAVREQVERAPAPDLMLAWIGANDFRPFVDRTTRRRFEFHTPGFAEAYAARVAAMVEEARRREAKVAWIGLPNMRERPMADAARRLNEIQGQAAAAAGALFVPTWEATSDAAGQFRASVAGADRVERRLRADDGVHFSDLGYRSIARIAFAALAEQMPEAAATLGAAAETLNA